MLLQRIVATRWRISAARQVARCRVTTSFGQNDSEVLLRATACPSAPAKQKERACEDRRARAALGCEPFPVIGLVARVREGPDPRSGPHKQVADGTLGGIDCE